jgi:hypothetical protein
MSVTRSGAQMRAFPADDDSHALRRPIQAQRARDLGSPRPVVGLAFPVIGGVRNFDMVCHCVHPAFPGRSMIGTG